MERNVDKFRLIFVILYVLCTFLFGSLFIMLFSFIIANIRGEDANGVMNVILGNKNYTPSFEEIDCANAAKGYGNALSYLVMFIAAIFLMKTDLKADFISLKENKKFYSIYIIITAIIFTGLAYLISFLVGLGVKDSENQKTIVEIMKTTALVPMIISTAIFAPVIEELIYRKIVFHYTSRFKIVYSYIISIVLFTFPHIISSIGSFNALEYLLMMIPYILDAFMLAFIYHKGKFNIYTSIACHILNNILAIILVFV